MKKALIISLYIVLITFFCLYIIYRVTGIPMNTDGACMMLYAEDILNGNVFLSGWSLTGLTFLTTDLPFYIIGVAIAGVGLNAFRIAVTLMYIFMAACAALVAFYNINNKKIAAIVFAGFGLFPTTYALSNAFVHTAVFALSFLAIFFAVLYDDKPSKIKAVAFMLITALAVCGDYTSLALIVFPIAVLCILSAFKNSVKVFLSLTAGCGIGIILEKVYLFIGKADLNSLSRTHFAESAYIPGNIRLYFEYVLKLINSSFFEKNLFSIKTAVFALKICILIFAVYAMFIAIKSLVLKMETDAIISALTLGLAAVTGVLWLSDMTTDITTGRYIAFLPLLVSVVLARTVGFINFETKTARTAVAAVFALLLISNFIPHGSSFSPYNRYSELAEFLESKNLTHGYASFWDSSVIDGYSGGKVMVNPIKATETGIAPRMWFCKEKWYDEPANFIIYRRENASDEESNYNYNGIYNMHLDGIKQHGKTYEKPMTLEGIISFFGEPIQTEHFKNYDILIYDNLSGKLEKSQ